MRWETGRREAAHDRPDIAMTGSPDPWDRARTAWEDRLGGLAVERDRWFRAFLCMAVLAAVTVCFGIWAAVRSEYVPYIVAVDELGQTAPILAPKEIRDWPDAAVRHELAAFLRDWRSVSTDTAVMRGRLRRIQHFLERDSTADSKIVEWATDPATSPFRTAERQTVAVAVASVVHVGGRSWLAEWTETRRSRSVGTVDDTRRFQGTFVLGQRRIADQPVLMQNPMGMVVENFDIVRVR